MKSKHRVHRIVSPHRVLQENSYPFYIATKRLRECLKKGFRGEECDFSVVLRTMVHCYPRQNDIIWVSVPRAGHNWLSAIYTILVEQVYNNRTIDFKEVPVYRPHVYRHIPIRYDLKEHKTKFYYHLPIPRLMHTHRPYMPFFQNRKILLQVRHPEDVLISKYYHEAAYVKCGFDEWLATYPSLSSIASIYNSWGKAVSEGRLRNYHCLKYEDLKSNPVEEVQKVLQFFGFPEVSTSVIQDAVDKTNIALVRQVEMERKGISDQRLVRGGRSGKVGQKSALSPNEQDALARALRENFDCHFRYLSMGGT